MCIRDRDEVMPELDILYMTRVQRERFFNEEDYLRLKDSYKMCIRDRERMERELLIHAPLEEVVLSYAANAAAAGLDGVVCSPLEAGAIHRRCGASFLTVTPGVRFAGGDAGDQKRVTTPAKARELGSDYIVVGRPITQAEDPVAAYRRCVKEFAG